MKKISIYVLSTLTAFLCLLTFSSINSTSANAQKKVVQSYDYNQNKFTGAISNKGNYVHIYVPNDYHITHEGDYPAVSGGGGWNWDRMSHVYSWGLY